MNEARTLQQLSPVELRAELVAAEKSLQEARFQVRLGKEKRMHLVGQLRRKIARIKTFLSAKSSTPAA